MIIHIIFQILTLIIGLALMITSLLLDGVLSADDCTTNPKDRETITKLREKSRIALGVGTFLVAMIITIIIYSFSKANAGITTFNAPSAFVKWLYGILLLVFGITILVLSFQIGNYVKSLSSTECKSIDRYLVPLYSTGGVIVALGVINFVILIANAGKKSPQTKGPQTKQVAQRKSIFG